MIGLYWFGPNALEHLIVSADTHFIYIYTSHYLRLLLILFFTSSAQ